jgi:hypothetical protein
MTEERTVFAEAADLLDELAAEAVRGGASDWFVAGVARKLGDLRNPRTVEDARKIKGVVDMIESVARKRSPRFEEILVELDVLLLPIDAVWRLGGSGPLGEA